MIHTYTWRVGAAELAPAREWVMKLLRFRPGTTVPDERALAEVDAARAAVAAVAVPVGAWTVPDGFAVGNGSVTLAGTTIAAPKLAAHLAGCGSAAVFAVTIGPGVEALLTRLFAEDRYAQAVAADAWGSAFAEAAADRVNAAIAAAARAAGWQTTPRFSPGYSGWAQTDNARLLSFLPETGITANPAGMLHPQKSVTAIVGWRRAQG